MTQRSISVIVPTCNEADSIAATLASVDGADDVECIVVDGDSRDGTLQIARDHGCRIARSLRGRARQMNHGASLATGDILLFLHADTLLPGRFDRHVRRLLSGRDVVAGAFALRIDGPGPALRVIEAVANRRAGWFHFPYGDQALFLPSALFRDLGGYPELPIMEDFELVRMLRRRGRVVIAEQAVKTRDRRWRRLGPIRTTWVNQMAVVGYLAGVRPERIARWYSRGAEDDRRAPPDDFR